MEEEAPPFLRDNVRDRAPRQPAEILDEQRGYYFVTERKADEDNGDSVWKVLSLDPAEQGKEILIRVPRHDPDRPNLLRTLSEHWRKAKLHLVLREGSESYEVLAAEPTLKETERAVHDDLGHAYTWAKELDDTVDQYFHHKVQEFACVAHQHLLDSPTEWRAIRDNAASIFASAMSESGDQRPASELMEVFNRGITKSLEGAHESYADILLGRQVDDEGQVTRMFYDPSRPFSEQDPGYADATARATATANYAAQRAAYEQMQGIVNHVEETPEGRYSLLKRAEHELVERKVLFGFHPTRTDDDYIHLTREFSSRISAMMIQGAMRATGAEAISPGMDHVTPTSLSQREGDGTPYTIQSYFNRRIKQSGNLPAFADFDAQNGDPREWFRRYNAECLEMTRGSLDAKEQAVAAEMDRAMAPGRSRTADWDERMNRRLHALTAGERAFMGFFEALEDGPEIV